eukprot:SAG31_NODE_1245_length_9134_cov_6.012064_8_plen_38_part_00
MYFEVLLVPEVNLVFGKFLDLYYSLHATCHRPRSMFE